MLKSLIYTVPHYIRLVDIYNANADTNANARKKLCEHLQRKRRKCACIQRKIPNTFGILSLRLRLCQVSTRNFFTRKTLLNTFA